MIRNRGETPNINTNNNQGYSAPHYRHYWNGRFVIIKYDKTFLAIELIANLLILLIVFAVYLSSSQISFMDPIAEIKSNFLTAGLVAIIISIIATVLVTFLTRSSKEKLTKNLKKS